MMFKAVLFCAFALLIQSISGRGIQRISLPSPVSVCSAPVCGSPVTSCGSPVASCGSPVAGCGSPVANRVSPVANRVSPISSCASPVSNNGGSLIVTSVGPVVPSGIAVASELGLCGDLAVNGALPFLSAVSFEGSYPTSGSAAVSYGCGDGIIGITQELGNPSGVNAASGSGLSVGSLGCPCAFK